MTEHPGQRRFDPPRRVLVEHDGEWLPAWQDGWVRWPDGTWRASVEYLVQYEWGQGKHTRTLPADRVRPWAASGPEGWGSHGGHMPTGPDDSETPAGP